MATNYALCRQFGVRAVFHEVHLVRAGRKRPEPHPRAGGLTMNFMRFVLAIIMPAILLVLTAPSASAATAEAGSAVWGGRPATAVGSDTWKFSTPTALDVVRFTEGENETDGFVWPGASFLAEPKFDIGPPVGGRFLTGFHEINGFGPPCSDAETGGSGNSSPWPAPSWGTNYTVVWIVTASGSLGTIPTPSWKSKATGNDPWAITPAQLTAVGVTGTSYDLFFALALSSGSYSSLGGISLTAYYDTATASTNVLNIWVSDTSIAVTSGVSATTVRLYRLANLEEGPTENPANQTNLTALRNAIQADVSGDQSLDTPVYIGVILENLIVPTVDLGDGSVAKIRVSSAARDAAGAVSGPISGLKITGHVVSTLSWSAESTSDTYDVVKGSLAMLRSTRGDFTASVQGCVENNSSDLSSSDSEVPSIGSGFYYVVRGRGFSGTSGTYDDGGNQVGWRDAEIEAAAGTCP